MKRVLLITLLLLIVAAGAAFAQSSEPDEETFFLTFVPNIQFSPMYMAIEQGYFAAQGIEVMIEHGDEPVGVDLIAAGQRNFGMVSGEQVIAARAQDRPVVMVYQWFHDFPIGIIYNPASGIDEVSDLAGRRVGLPGRFGASYTGLIALLNAHGLSEDDLDLEEIGFNAPEVFCLGRVDAAVVYINNEPQQIANRIAAGDCGEVEAIDVFPVAASAPLVSNGLVTSEALLAADPDRVARFVTAFDAGLREVITNPALAYVISAEYVETLPLTDALRAALQAASDEQEAFLAITPDADADLLADRRAELLAALQVQFTADEVLQFTILLATIDLWQADLLGGMRAEDWTLTQDVLVQMGFVTNPIIVEDAFTNDFVPAQ